MQPWALSLPDKELCCVWDLMLLSREDKDLGVASHAPPGSQASPRAHICEPATGNLPGPTPGPSNLQGAAGLSARPRPRDGQDGAGLCALGGAELWKVSSLWLMLTSKGSKIVLTVKFPSSSGLLPQDIQR